MSIFIAETSSLFILNNWFNWSSQTNSSIICISNNQDETSTNEATYIDNEGVSLLSSSVVPKNAIEERTKIILSGNLLTCKSITSNHDSDDKSTDNDQIEQVVNNNPDENVNLHIYTTKWPYVIANKYPYATC